MKPRTLLFLLFVTTSSLAHEGCEETDYVNELHRYLSWNSASTEEIQKAPCKSLKTPSNPEMLNYINSVPSGNQNSDIHGVRFVAERPLLLEAFRKLTTMRDTLGYQEEPSAQVDLQNRFSINPACSKVLCAVEKIWGPEMGKKILFLELAFNVNASELSIDGTSRFTPEELNDVILAINDVPKELRSWPRQNQPIVRYERGKMPYFHEGTKTEADAGIMLYDRWASKSSTGRQYVVFHEIAHNISRHLGNLDESPEWFEKSGWVKLGEDWSHGKEYCAVSNYGARHPDEDFAETLSAYRYNGKALKKRCPEKYEFAKKRVFHGREFLEQDCGK